MTMLDFQDELTAEIEKILKGYECKTPNGNMEPFKFYKQDIPFQDSEDDEDPVPYVIVRLKSGEDKGEKDSFHDVKVVIIIGIWDDDKDAQGYRTIADVVTKIYTHFASTGYLQSGIFSGEFDWALQQDGYYPYWFGAIETKFHIAAVRRDNEWI